MNGKEFELFDEYAKITSQDFKEFNSSLNSQTIVKSNYHKVEYDLSWLDIMENTIHYIDNILRNPKRFIINEEELVKVEKSKKVTVESVIHLSQHTNLITDYDELSGEVKPSKILNVLKEETLDTYENRFIYSLIINMNNFINIYGKEASRGSSVNSSKNLNYEATAKKGGEDINITLSLDAVNNSSLDKLVNGLSVKDRIARLQEQITDFTSSDLYKDLARMHAPIVRSPIRKTNVILKNPNFQKAEQLWNFLERYDKDLKKETRYSRNLSDNQDIKSKLDLSFLLDYSIIDNLSKSKVSATDWEEINLNMLKRSVKTYLDFDPDINETEFLRIMKKEYKEAKRIQGIRFNEIKKIIESELNSRERKIKQAINSIKAEL